MGSLYRNEDMVLCQMYLQADAAYSCVSQLGELGIVQFKDLNANVNMFQRQFVSEIRRCEEMERQLRYFEREMAKHQVVAVDAIGELEMPAPRDIVDLEATFESMEADLKDLNNSVESLERNYVELQELMYVLDCTDPFFAHGVTPYDMELHDSGQIDPTTGSRMQLRYLAGVIPMARLGGFSRLLWFASRGNIFLRHVEIPHPVKDPHTEELVHKAVFLAVFQGEHLMNKVRKISEGYKATIYPCPEKMDERRDMLQSLRMRLTDLDTVLNKSREQRTRMLQTVARNVNAWSVKTCKLKAVYLVMNMFQNEGQNYVAEGWLPYAELGTVQAVLNRASALAGNHVSSLLHPIVADTLPTYHKVNKFTRAFQAIIDAYGVASYKEVNPAAFSIITFPFLFSVMFGDAGHGLLMLVFAIFLVARERQLLAAAMNSEMFGMIYHGRYVVLLMSLFSIYAGLIYNDVFSKSLNIFGSAWSGKCMPEVNTTDGIHVSAKWQLNPSNNHCYHGEPYIFGVDPVWQMGDNKIMFTNSFKKKISVIFGVSQMLLGVILSLCNHLYFRRYLNILTEFIPQLLFLMAIFGYLCALIFTKWLLPTDYFPPARNYYDCSPNILIGFINMFMMSYPPEGSGSCSNWTWFPGQQALQTVLVVVAVICAVWMLLSKPLVLMYRHKHKHHSRLVEEPNEATTASDNAVTSTGASRVDVDVDDQLLSDVSMTDVSEGPSAARNQRILTMPAPVEEEFDAGEVFVHQAIHTIEYCLGCISHTASYLRLWALSLAHAQLSEVLWSMVLQSAFSMHLPTPYLRCALIFLFFAPFAVLTVVILLIMEGLSAFLHTLRLHWVEFNSKFYQGEGMLFIPFSFDDILKAREW